MEISVIIPTFRPQEYLWECLDSLKAQTLSSDLYEIIIVLNGEKHPYWQQIEEYISDMSGIRLIYSQERGVSNARNSGLDKAEGRFIVFIDDDDKVSPTYLQELYEKADEQTIVLSNTYNFTDDNPDNLIPVRPTELHRILSSKGRIPYIESRRFFFTVWMKLIPAAVIGDRRFDPTLSIGEDSTFMFLISDRIRYTDFTSKDAIYYRRLRGNSAMSLHNGKGRRSMVVNDLRLIRTYTRIYLSGLCRYSFRFYITRVRGAIHI